LTKSICNRDEEYIISTENTLRWGGIVKNYVILFIIGLITSPFVIMNMFSFNENYQIVVLKVRVLDSSGKPLSYASITVFNITEKGSYVIYTCKADEFGIADITMRIRRRHVGWTNLIMKDGEIKYVEIPRPLFAIQNFIITVYGRKEYMVYALPINPTFTKWPVDTIELEIKTEPVTLKPLSEEDKAKLSNGDEFYELLDWDEKWKYTTCAIIATWYNISAGYNWPKDCLEEVSFKWRWSYDLENWSPWYSSGYTLIEFDRKCNSNGLAFTGNKKVAIKFEFKYRIERWKVIVYDGVIYEDRVFGVNTNNDPRGWREAISTWDGRKKGGNYYEIPQGRRSDISVTGGIEWQWHISLSFSLSVPPSASVSINLDLCKYEIPVATVTYVAGTWYSGYSVYVYDAGSNWEKSFATWRTQP